MSLLGGSADLLPRSLAPCLSVENLRNFSPAHSDLSALGLVSGSKISRKAAGKLPDIRAVAAVAKVSIATVSRTINGSPLVSDRLNKRVWQAIKQLNYLPNTHARTLVSGRSRLFGIIVENITNPFFPELIQSFEEIAVAHGYEILGQLHQQRSRRAGRMCAPHVGAQGGRRCRDDLRRRGTCA